MNEEMWERERETMKNQTAKIEKLKTTLQLKITIPISKAEPTNERKKKRNETHT